MALKVRYAILVTRITDVQGDQEARVTFTIPDNAPMYNSLAEAEDVLRRGHPSDVLFIIVPVYQKVP